MVEDDRCGGEGARQVDRVHELRMVLPAFEAEAERRQLGEALAKFRIEHLMRRDETRDALAHCLAARPPHAGADAAGTGPPRPELRPPPPPHPRTAPPGRSA